MSERLPLFCNLLCEIIYHTLRHSQSGGQLASLSSQRAGQCRHFSTILDVEHAPHGRDQAVSTQSRISFPLDALALCFFFISQSRTLCPALPAMLTRFSASSQWVLIFAAGAASLVLGKRYSKNQADAMYKEHYSAATTREDITAAIKDHVRKPEEK